MKATVFSVVLLAAFCSSPAVAHIHSQKVTHIRRDKISLETWALALISSVLVAAAGIFPLLLNRCFVNLDGNGLRLRAVLSFAVGGLLGDVFLHLLPEAWGSAASISDDWQIGAWALMGLISFLLVEKMANSTESVKESEKQTDWSSSGNVAEASRTLDVRNGGSVNTHTNVSTIEGPGAERRQVDVRGYLNLVANCTDNFTHGLAIAASYVASPTVGMLTTAAILCHEIPHEVGDFAILLSSGFDIWSAAKAQALTATGGLVGVVAGLTAEHLLSSTSSWLLPFTAGGFLYIALVSIVPQLLEDTTLTYSLVQMIALILGVVVMAMVSIVEKQSCKHLPFHPS